MMIGLTGRAGSGKDTVARLLQENYGFTPVSFADPIKRAVCVLIGVPYSKWDDREWREHILPVFKCSPRYLAQTLGTEWGRDCIHKHLWRDLAMVNAMDLPRVVFTDVRYDNEAEAIRLRGGYVVRIFRKDNPNWLSCSHLSERGVSADLIDFTINNDGAIEDLVPQVAYIMNKVSAS